MNIITAGIIQFHFHDSLANNPPDDVEWERNGERRKKEMKPKAEQELYLTDYNSQFSGTQSFASLTEIPVLLVDCYYQPHHDNHS